MSGDGSQQYQGCHPQWSDAVGIMDLIENEIVTRLHRLPVTVVQPPNRQSTQLSSLPDSWQAGLRFSIGNPSGLLIDSYNTGCCVGFVFREGEMAKNQRRDTSKNARHP